MALSYCYCSNRLPFYVLHCQLPTRKVEKYFLPLLDTLKTIAVCIKATLSLRSRDKLSTLVLQLVQNGYRMLYGSFDGLATLLICP